MNCFENLEVGEQNLKIKLKQANNVLSMIE